MLLYSLAFYCYKVIQPYTCNWEIQRFTTHQFLSLIFYPWRAPICFLFHSEAESAGEAIVYSHHLEKTDKVTTQCYVSTKGEPPLVTDGIDCFREIAIQVLHKVTRGPWTATLALIKFDEIGQN